MEAVAKLISNPSDYPRAYICSECINVCASIIEDEREAQVNWSEFPKPEQSHALLDHPLISRFLVSVEKWIEEESLGKDAAHELAEVRSIAKQMVSRSS